MPGIGIMTDSNCGIMPSEEKSYGIHVLPMPIIIDGNTYSEGIDITPDEFYQKQTAGCDYDELVFIPMSSGLSNTCQTARIFADDEPYRGRVHVVDNHRISVTQAVSVLDAKILSGRGLSGTEIKAILEQEALYATIYIAVDTLEYLKKDISTRLAPLKEQGSLKIGLANTLMSPEKLETFKAQLRSSFPDMDLVYFALTMSIGTHVGPGGLGIGAVRCRSVSDTLPDSLLF